MHFFSELVAGRILSREALAQMRETVLIDAGGFAGGLGIFSTELPCGRFWGHDGAILDYVTSVRASEDGERVMVISVQGGGLSGPPPDEAALLCEAT